MPKCYAYGRASTSKQGMTREVQESACRTYYDTHLKNKGIEWAGFFYDAAITGDTIFSERELGRQVFFSLQRGDYLICNEMDRLFRNKADGFATLDQLDRKGVKRVVLNLPDLSGMEIEDDIRDGMESYAVIGAYMWRRMHSRKMKRDNQVKRENGLPFSRSSPIGWRQIGTRVSKQYRTNDYERSVIDTFASFSQEGMTCDQIALWFLHEENKGRFRDKVCRRFTHENTVRWALRARAAGYPMITNRDEFTRWWSSRHVALSTP